MIGVETPIRSRLTVATVTVETVVETMAGAEAVVGRVHDELAHQGSITPPSNCAPATPTETCT